MAGISVRAFNDTELLGQFNYTVDVLESMRLVEPGVLTKTIPLCNMLVIVAPETDDDNLYRVIVEQVASEISRANNLNILNDDMSSIIYNGAILYAYHSGGMVQGTYQLSDNTFHPATVNLDGEDAIIRYQTVSSRLLMVVPLIPGNEVQVSLLSDNNHSVNILFCKRT